MASQRYHYKQIDRYQMELEEEIDTTGGLFSQLRSYGVIKHRQELNFKLNNASSMDAVGNCLNFIQMQNEDTFLNFAAALIQLNQKHIIEQYFKELFLKANTRLAEIKAERYKFNDSSANASPDDNNTPTTNPPTVAVISPQSPPDVVSSQVTSQPQVHYANTASAAPIGPITNMFSEELESGELPVQCHGTNLQPGEDITKHQNKWIQWLRVPDIDKMNKPYRMRLPNRKITIAVVDSGISNIHKDCKNLVQKSENFVRGDDADLLIDKKGHGTACAGIIAQTHQHQTALQIYNIKVVPCVGATSTVELSDALKKLGTSEYDNVDIVSLSLGTRILNETVAKSVQNLWPHKVIVASAANEGNRAATTTQPLAKESIPIICVGSCDEYGNRSRFSSRGPTLFCLAPGLQVVSARTKTVEDYALYDGTSFSTPWVAAMVAHIIARAELLKKEIGLHEDVIRQKLRNTDTMAKVLKKMCSHSDRTRNDPKFEEEGYGPLNPWTKMAKDEEFVSLVKSIIC